MNSNVARKNITYSVQPIQGIKTQYEEGETIRIVYRGSDNGLIDLRNSTLNFQLNMPVPASSTKTTAACPNDTVASIFQVQSITVGGQQLNYLISDYRDQFIRKIRQRSTGNGGQYMSGVDFTNNYKIPTLITTPAIAQLVSTQNYNNPNEYMANFLNQQKIENIMRHYTFTDAGGPPITSEVVTKNAATSAMQQYSVKLGELVAELLDFKPVDSQLLLSLGLEIQLRLLPFNKCMGYLHVGTAKTTPGNYNVPDLQTYSISNLFMGTVNISYANPMADRSLMKTDMPFQTFHAVTQAVTVSNYQCSWALPSSAFVNGIIIAFNAVTPYTSGSLGALPTRATFDVVPPLLTAGQGNYAYSINIKDTQLQVGNTTYPASLPPYTRSYQKLQTGAAFSELILGSMYESTLPGMLSYDYFQFLPIQANVMAGQLFQLYQTYDDLETTLNPAGISNMQVTILTVCERVLSLDQGMVVLR